MGCGASRHGVHALIPTSVVPGGAPLSAVSAAAARKAESGEGEALVVPPSSAPSANVARARIEGLEARLRDLMAARRAARLGLGPACAYELASVLQQTPTVAPMRVIPFAELRAASRAGRVSALADSPDGATVDVTELPEHARAKIILVSHRWWSSVNAQPDRVERGWVRAAQLSPGGTTSRHGTTYATRTTAMQTQILLPCMMIVLHRRRRGSIETITV